MGQKREEGMYTGHGWSIVIIRMRCGLGGGPAPAAWPPLGRPIVAIRDVGHIRLGDRPVDSHGGQRLAGPNPPCAAHVAAWGEGIRS